MQCGVTLRMARLSANELERWRHRQEMKKLILTAAAIAAGLPAYAASVTNKDDVRRTLIVTERGAKSELVLSAGETVEFCSSGCFVTMPNGDREALSGNEAIEISGGRAKFR